ncbi:hypothetical protein [Actinoplanes couchii]|uniref:Uncharacterized protein n=1 Tax=Actinoplanes couchii TaxID=403638 RepID=A0ABQ3XDS5_9ACTN|nr:hypothetical protein [Actinoplanes couchii]MDR6317163.1 hypothetical protein [Actinoplanes couchii]GID56657.1 hypothetical protein Aco03nite_050610 [Actinoplanes couchii]
MTTQLTADAARLVGYGLRPRLVPARDDTYRGLIVRASTDDEFAAAVQAVAAGFDLVVMEISERAGIVVASTDESVFAIRAGDYWRRAGGDGKASDRVLHALAHLGAATMAFPRPADLANETYLGRITVDGVEAFVREAAGRLAEAAVRNDDADTAAGEPGLEASWRVYSRRAQTGSTGDGRRLPSSTTGIVGRALTFLSEQGLLTRTGDERHGTYRTTPRYRTQVREAGVLMFDELLSLGITAISDGSATIEVAWTPEALTEL